MSNNVCDPNSVLLGYAGISAGMVFANLGSAYATAKAGCALSMCCCMNPKIVIKSIIPVVMAGIIAVYGLILSILISQKMMNLNSYSWPAGYAHLAAGLIGGLSCLVSGLSIGIVSDAGIRGMSKQSRLFVVMILILIFSEAIALFGIITAMSLIFMNFDNLCIPWKHFQV